MAERDQSFGERVARADERERTLDEVEQLTEDAGVRAKAYLAIVVWATVLAAVLLPIWAVVLGLGIRAFRWTSGL